MASVSWWPSRTGLSKTGKQGITLSLHQANVNATRQEGAEDLSLCGEGKKGEETELLQEPPTTSNWSCAALTLGSPSICSASGAEN